jgi:hypothetical protein
MASQIVFIHIPKTAGSSFLSTLVKANLSSDEMYNVPGGILSVMRRNELSSARKATFIHGHLAHGIHHLTRQPTQYTTFLRDPIDRAISWYYWIKDLKRIDLFRRHPLRNYADSVSIKEFYENRSHSNEQTRYLSGALSNSLYKIWRFDALDRWHLKRAKKHLEACTCFGLLEHFDLSVALFQKTFNWHERIDAPRRRKTRKRPTLDEIKEIAPSVITELREYHKLDLELYEFARNLFRERVRAAGLTFPDNEN